MAPNNMTIERFDRTNEATVKFLLVAAQLPVADLCLSKLEHFIVARNADGALIGAVGLEPFGEVGLLRSLVVHTSRRGGGLGQALTRQLENGALKLGVRSMYLLTTTAADFFPKLGYRAIERAEVPEAIAATEEFKNICPASAVCMAKTL